MTPSEQAAYERGVADERGRCAKICEEHWHKFHASWENVEGRARYIYLDMKNATVHIELAIRNPQQESNGKEETA